MSHRKLPSLNALRCFEAAARHSSVRGAADELNLTHGAVSHQVKLLEDTLGLALFERVGKRLKLTPAGIKLGNALTEGLDNLAGTLRELIGYQGLSECARQMKIAVTPSFGANWLLPRIFEFIERHPGFEFTLLSENLDPLVQWDDVDVAVQYGGTDWGKARWWRTLRQVDLRPVCSPRLFNGKWPLRSVGDLAGHRLLHEDDGSEWRRWLTMCGGPVAKDNVYFSNVDLALDAARSGHGIALVSSTLTESDERKGHLIVPFDAAAVISASQAYVCICDNSRLRKPVVSSFIDWLLISMGHDIPSTRGSGSDSDR